MPEDYLPVPAEPNTDDTRRRANAEIVKKLRAAATIIELAASVDEDLPEVISVGVTGELITIHPWKPGAPVQAMRQFEALMSGPIERKAHPYALTGAEQVSVLSAIGDIDGVRIEVHGATHHDTPVDGFLGVTDQAEAAIATTEIPIADPADSLVLAEMAAEKPAEAAPEPVVEAIAPAAPESPTVAIEAPADASAASSD